MATSYDNVSPDLIWECVNNQNSYLHKTKTAGGQYFSKDPLNLTNKHTRKQEGFVNSKAIGIQRPPGSNKGLSVTTKTTSKQYKPASSLHTAKIGPSTPSRKVYRSLVNSTARKGYRPDLRGEAVARASAIKLSQKPKKDLPAKKLRGSKARKAAAIEE